MHAGSVEARPDDPELAVLAGRVTDMAGGGPIEGALIRVAGRSERSDASGQYRLTLPPGRHRVRVEAAGFHAATILDQRVSIPDPAASPHAAGEAPSAIPAPIDAGGDEYPRLDIALPPIDPSAAEARAVVERLREEPELSADLEGLVSASSDAPAEDALRILSLDAVEAPPTIRVQMPDGKITEMATDTYLKGVVPAEMGFVFRRGFEALKAQAIASRTYAASRCLPASAGDPDVCEPGLDANVDTTTRTQVWRPVHYDITDAAVEATHGQVVLEEGAIINALFFARAAGRTLDSEDSRCCGGRSWPYLRGVGSPEAFAERRGHGAGMSQEGAAAFADWGARAEEIVEHYYRGASAEPDKPPRLYGGAVLPREGTERVPIEFSVGYVDPNGDPPVTRQVVIDDVAYVMRGPSGRDHDYAMGAAYVYSATLAAGAHAVRFVFSDGRSDAVVQDAGSISVLPAAVEGASEPSASPAPSATALPGPLIGPLTGVRPSGTATAAPGGVGSVGSAVAPEPDRAAPAAAAADENATGEGLADGISRSDGPVGASSAGSNGTRAGSARFGFEALQPAETSPGERPSEEPALSGFAAEPAGASSGAGTDADPAAEAEEPSAAVEEAEAVLETPIVEADFSFMAVGARWSTDVPDAGHVHLDLRTSRDGGTWSAWTPMLEMNEDGPEAEVVEDAAGDGDDRWSRLVIARGRFLQARARIEATDAEAVRIEDLELHYFNSDIGPQAPSGEGRIGAAAVMQAGPRVITRAEWGADERKRFDGDGAQIWPPFYTAPRAQIVHHTVTTNDPADPAAVVRSIYQYHAVTRGWGDIGYNFLIDHRGNVYEGRFGGERDGRISQGGHARQYNSNSIGIALLGTFTEPAARPSSTSEGALVELLAHKGVRYQIDPDAPVTLAGTRFAHAVMGHRDALAGSTQCPGEGVYGRLGSIRTGVRVRMNELGLGGGPPPTAVPTQAPSPRPSSVPTVRPPTPAPLPTLPPGECEEALVNGGFESPAEDARWLRNRAYLSTWNVFRGERALFIGLRNEDPDEAESYASGMQVLRLPGRVAEARLRFAALGVGREGDLRIVRVLGQDGSVIALAGEKLPAGEGWQTYAFDLSDALDGRGGEEIRIYFGVINNGDGQRAYLRLDDVSLLICGDGDTGAQATVQPSPSPTARATAAPVSTEAPSATATAFDVPTEIAYPGPGGRPTATASPPIERPGPRCAPILSNAFDDEASDWARGGDHPVTSVRAPGLEGGGLRLGLINPEVDRFGYASIEHPLPMPAGAVSATVSLSLAWPLRADEDAVIVELRRPSTGERELLLPTTLGQGAASAGAALRPTRYRLEIGGAWLQGEPSLYLAVLNRGQREAPGAVTAMVVDDVRVEACRLPGRAWLPRLDR